MPDQDHISLPAPDQLPGMVRDLMQQVLSFRRVFQRVLEIDEGDKLDRVFWLALKEAIAYAIKMQKRDENTDKALAWVNKHINQDTDRSLEWLKAIKDSGKLEASLAILADLNRNGDLVGVTQWARENKETADQRQKAKSGQIRTLIYTIIGATAAAMVGSFVTSYLKH
jgi:hypothetical protein